MRGLKFDGQIATSEEALQRQRLQIQRQNRDAPMQKALAKAAKRSKAKGFTRRCLREIWTVHFIWTVAVIVGIACVIYINDTINAEVQSWHCQAQH
jgi:hypothetical protein